MSQVVTDFDAFPKIPETYIEQTTTGGSGKYSDGGVHISLTLYIRLVSIITFLLVLMLLYVEFNYFLHPTYKFRFTPDSEFTAKLKLNVDLTVAMPCDCKFPDLKKEE